MDTKLWHVEAVPAGAVEVLKKPGRQQALEGFYLAGGTALALIR